MEENKIVLKSTQKGHFSQYFWAIAWFIAFWALASWSSGFRESIDRYDFPWPHIIMYVSYVIMGIIAFCNVHDSLYESREVNTFYQNKEGFWGKLICESYGFPFSKNTNQTVFDRIVQIEVVQGSICRILNTGTLKVELITFTNADSQESTQSIPAIKNPFERKAEIEKALLAHKGLRVKLETKKSI